jgi:hypothetical protein
MMPLPPHCYPGRPIRTEGLVIHYISLINADPENWDNPQRIWEFLCDFNRPHNKRMYGTWEGLPPQRMYGSYNWLITGMGDRITLVPEGQEVWHAGKSYFRGKKNCNKFTAGVALVAAPQAGREYGFTEGHYRATAELILDTGFEHTVTTHERVRKEYMQRHPEDDQVKPKHDPGPTWDWSRINRYLRYDLNGG